MELYVHIPFCRKKCKYCDFISYPGRSEEDIKIYVDALLREAEILSKEVDEAFDTVFIGGGTPSLLPPDQLRRLFSGLSGILSLGCVREWTVEANPESCSKAWLDAAIAEGANRLSMGMQASQSALLSTLGRIHSFDQVSQSVEYARAAGFKNLNLDLMFGLPNQTPEAWMETLRAALNLKPDHFSVYGLILEEGTMLEKEVKSGILSLPAEDVERLMYDEALNLLGQHGYVQYEISNFAREGYACAHNIGYWTQVPYLGLGVASASMLHLRKEAGGLSYLRRTAAKDLETYLSGISAGYPLFSEENWISPSESRFETMMLGLRMTEGVSEDAFLKLHGKTLEACYGEKLSGLMDRGLLRKDGASWKLTRRGMDIQNMVLVELMED